MKATMLVATHKAADVPSDDFYLPIHVGHALNPVDLGYQPDDTGENISRLNKSYCELTALYWAWKNLDTDIIGLSHYRRYFRGTQPGPSSSRILALSDAFSLFARNDILLSKPRNYYFETIESHYRHAHHGTDIDTLREVVAEASGHLLPAYDQVFSGRKLSLYNMFLMKREHFDSYASWLFPTLTEAALRIGDNQDRTDYQRRTVGYLAERLLNVWTVAHSDALRVGHLPVVNTEGEPKLRKGIAMVKRRIAGPDAAHTRTS